MMHIISGLKYLTLLAVVYTVFMGKKAVVFKTFLCVYAVFRTTPEGSVPLYLQILREAESAVSLPFSQGLCIWPR